ncbi:hypothetical protein LJ737_25545 [Hymenobacter sp. 15J16-1T3B]|uniref:hypothetical protein n=1 Tax=Hymenobacter sp. 15J16-1T3B TaxID=2886941 RepID=UPI001D107DE8|nr:hypothetical protein [Hymenobacter sp. 15J16-1T3B]MCC3160628.1 hypothetical protein [Hymenobacter sp. 15J16-1T3B]
MPTSTLSSSLRLHMVPAGRRLDFAQVPGHYAYVYRRSRYAPWECIAHNARSPFVDSAPLPVGAPTEYVVVYQDAAGHVTAATSIVPALSAQLPPTTCLLGLR